MIDHGGLVYLGPPEGLAGGADRLVLRPQDPTRLDDLATLAASSDMPTKAHDGNVVVTLGSPDDVDPTWLSAEINRRSHAAGIVLVELHHERTDLETRYLNLVNAPNDASADTSKGTI